MKKIIVIGANQNALAFAKFVSNSEYKVVLYEKKSKDEVAYPWTDDINPHLYESVGLPMPPNDVFYRTRCLTFVSPDKENLIHVPLEESQLDYSTKRRPFNDYLEGLAKEVGAEVNYSLGVKELIVKDQKVCGVILENGDKVNADLVVDCSGVTSKFRDSLNNFNIPSGINNSDMFFARRGYFKRKDGSEFPKHPKKLYLKHLNQPGISWCVVTKDENVIDVLIGRLGGLDDKTFNDALLDLKKDNDIIGDEIFISDVKKIPVRHPISRMFMDGYVLLGDSAFMTIPLIGSGIVSGIQTAKNLADTIKANSDNPFDSKNLYKYQVKFMKDMGAGFSAVDMLKNRFLKSEGNELNDILGCGIMSAVVLAVEGEKGKLVGGILKLMFKRPKLFFTILLFGVKMVKQVLKAIMMPKKYNDKKLLNWQRKYEKVYIQG